MSCWLPKFFRVCSAAPLFFIRRSKESVPPRGRGTRGKLVPDETGSVEGETKRGLFERLRGEERELG